MKPQSQAISIALCALAVWVAGSSAVAGEARFFRVVGPTPTTITALGPDGYITWTNAQTGGTYTVQTAHTLGSSTNWVDWVQVPVSNLVTTTRIFDLSPPASMALIPAGSFLMGATTNMGHEYYDDAEVPQHSVYVSAFYIEALRFSPGA